MSHNLLPKIEKKHLTQEYVLRLLIVTFMLCSVATVIGAVALVPSYVSISGEFSFLEERKKELVAEHNSDEKLQSQLKERESLVSFLEAKQSEYKYTQLLNEVLSRRPIGILITGFSYERANNMPTIQGVAETRDLVIPFAHTLEESKMIARVPVPIANLAKNSNIEFNLPIYLATTTVMQ